MSTSEMVNPKDFTGRRELHYDSYARATAVGDSISTLFFCPHLSAKVHCN